MRFSAQTFLKFRVLFFSFFSFALLFLFNPTVATAQTYQVAPYAQPNIDAGVPQNQHTFVQATIIEVLDTAVCALSGESAVNPEQGCLDVNPYTHKLGYAPHTKNSGGLVGVASNMIGALYTPTTSTSLYFNTVASNFGIVQHAYAAPSCLQTNPAWGYGFCGLQPLLQAWEAMRNIAYMFLILIFVLIGVGIMLRLKIDPRTVMTIQNQIPRVIVAILLITFSYAIAAVMIDAMWFTTYVGINTLTSFCPSNTSLCNPDTGNGTKLSYNATKTLVDTPLTYVNQVFHTDNPGIFHITDAVSVEIQAIVHQLILDVINGGNQPDCSWLPSHWDDCIKAAVAGFFSFLARIIMELIILITVIILLFRVWWHLLKAYIFILVSVITAPLWIVLGLLPSKPLGFEKWMRTIFSNLAVFPATVLLFVVARIFEEIFKAAPNPQDTFIPPLVGNPVAKDFGALIAFGVILMTPTLLDQIHTWMKTPKSGAGAAIRGGIAAGAAIPAYVTARQVAGWTRRDQHGNPIGPLARASTSFKKFMWTNPVTSRLPLVGDRRGTKRALMDYQQGAIRYNQVGQRAQGYRGGGEAAGESTKVPKRYTNRLTRFIPGIGDPTGKKQQSRYEQGMPSVPQKPSEQAPGQPKGAAPTTVEHLEVHANQAEVHGAGGGHGTGKQGAVHQLAQAAQEKVAERIVSPHKAEPPTPHGSGGTEHRETFHEHVVKEDHKDNPGGHK